MFFPNRSRAFFLRIEKGNDTFEVVDIPIKAEIERLNTNECVYSFNVPFRMGTLISQDFYQRIHLF